jgi:hypothetical protein
MAVTSKTERQQSCGDRTIGWQRTDGKLQSAAKWRGRGACCLVPRSAAMQQH